MKILCRHIEATNTDCLVLQKTIPIVPFVFMFGIMSGIWISIIIAVYLEYNEGGVWVAGPMEMIASFILVIAATVALINLAIGKIEFRVGDKHFSVFKGVGCIGMTKVIPIHKIDVIGSYKYNMCEIDRDDVVIMYILCDHRKIKVGSLRSEIRGLVAKWLLVKTMKKKQE